MSPHTPPMVPSAALDQQRWDGMLYREGWSAGSGGVIPVVEPSTGAVIATTSMATPDEMMSAATRAARAQRDWAAESPSTRATIAREAGNFFLRHAPELIEWVQRETGAIRAKAELEITIAANECFDAAALPHHPHGEVLTSDEPHWSFARRQPAGVVGVISPFNFPLILSIRSVAPALALGNSVILKPDPRTPVSGGYMIMRAFEEAGLPPGTLQLLPGGPEAGSALTEAPEVRVVSFTGSTAAGRKVGEACGRNLKRAHLELGGNNALIVLPGADLERAAAAGAFGSFLHQGQICMTTGRHLVHESIYEEYVHRLAANARALRVGDPWTTEAQLGPVIDGGQRDRILGLVRASEAAGATIVAGGAAEELFVRPTVLSGVGAENPAWTEEIFGPVAPVRPFSTLDEAVQLVHESAYGLAVGILGDVGLAMTVADQVRSGKIHINEQTVADESNAPFGGVGHSGTGARFGGYTANIDAFTETQWLTVRSMIAPSPFTGDAR